MQKRLFDLFLHYFFAARAKSTVGYLYEVKRIAYTIYNGMGNIPELWTNGQAKRRADGTPYIHLIVGAPEGVSVNGFWPWKDSRVLDILEACPCGDLYIDAWDVYKNGIFLRTEYQIF